MGLEFRNLAVSRLKDRFPQSILDVVEFQDETTLLVKREDVLGILRFLKEDEELSFNMLTDLTALDNKGRRPRFQVVYLLYSFRNNDRLRIKAGVPEEDARIKTVTSLWRAADWLERECYDMFGIVFEGHPDLRRILMWEEYEGWPLRKEHPAREKDKSIAPFGA